MGSTVNPFSIGIASGFANVSIGDGLPLTARDVGRADRYSDRLRARYAARVKAKPEASVVGFLPGDREQAAAVTAQEPPTLKSKDNFVLWAIALTFGFMIFSVIPWAEIFSGSGAEPYSWQLEWWFPQLAMLFLVAAVTRRPLRRSARESTQWSVHQRRLRIPLPGARDRAGARHLGDHEQHEDHRHGAALDGKRWPRARPKGVFAIVIFVVNLPIAFLIPSTSGHATLAMPILAPLSDFAHVSRALTVTAWNAASGWMNLWIPTTAVVMGGLALAKVGYDKYLKWLWPLLAIFFVVICAFVGIGAVIG